MSASAVVCTLLLDAIDQVETFVTVFIYVYTLLIFVYILTSWIRLPYSLSPVQRFLYDVCEPYLRLFRRIMPPLGPLDLSPIVAVLGLMIVLKAVTAVLDQLH